MQSETNLEPPTENQAAAESVNFRAGVWRRTALFLGSKAILIAITIFAGVFVTVLIANQSGQMEKNARSQVERYLSQNPYSQSASPTQTEAEYLAALRAKLTDEAGLNLPFWPRQVKWTLNALRMDWGRPVGTNLIPVFSTSNSDETVREVILRYFPRTILLAGASNLLIFICGIPLALYLSRHYGSWLDRLLAMLAPLSSIPSWVHAILLIAIFAAELRLLPFGGMLDTLPPETKLGYLQIVLRHMILPVLAIFLSTFFQLVSTWRTYFILYGDEDYVELGKAKGLSERVLERRYILQPALSYVITSFALTLVTFWQMTMALEVVFDWPGIGWLYIKKALPNYWGEGFYQGELAIAIGIVVIFAYLLGAVVFLLDLAYVLIDPRTQFSNSSAAVQLKLPQGNPNWRFWRKSLQPDDTPEKWDFHKAAQDWVEALGFFLNDLGAGLKNILAELRRSPTGMLGLTLILILILGSFYAVFALPYEKIGSGWSREVLTGRASTPKLAQPALINLFRQEKLLSTLSLNQQSPQVSRTEQVLGNGARTVTLDFAFDYPYAEPPAEIYLYLQADYLQKKPFVSLTWLTPDGRRFDLRGLSVGPIQNYDFEKYLPYQRLVAANKHLQQWFVQGQVFPTPAHDLLFVDPQAETLVTVHGTYHLQVNAMFFETAGDLRTELILLGQVYGLAGTDYLRRDLLVPLLWGLPFALLFGLLGAVVTTVLSMLVAASGVWFGGWVDNLIQRLTEANMILPVLAISVLAHALFNLSLWVILAVVILLNIFGSPTKTFRAAFLQMKSLPYIEAAQAYGASNRRIIVHYLLPRIVPILAPQLITLIPSFVFLEATLGLFNIKSDYPTWGTVIYQALTQGAMWGSRYWVLEPLGLLLLTGLAFAMLGSALERILNPRLQDQK